MSTRERATADGGDAAGIAQAIAAALEEAAIADWDRDDGDGKCIEIHVSQIAPIAGRVLRETGAVSAPVSRAQRGRRGR